MPPPLRLNVIAQPPTGPERRFALDATSKGDTPTGLSFSDTVPGGFESCEFSLLRDALQSNPELAQFGNFRVEGAGRELAWEGRIEGSPTSTGTTLEVSPSLVGWQAALEDNSTARMVYRETSLEQWEGMSRARKVLMIASGVRGIGDAEATVDAISGAPSLDLLYDGGSWAANYGPRIEGWYDAGGDVRIKKFWGRLAMDAILQFYYNPASLMRVLVWGSDNDNSQTESLTIAAAAASQDVSWSPTTPRRFIGVDMTYNVTTALGIGDNVQLLSQWQKLALHGDHGLTERGTEPDSGYWASDIIEHAVRTWAPALARSIDPTNFVIPQAAFYDPTTAAEIVRFANSYHLYDWGVWDDKTFHYYQRGNRGRKWRARVADVGLQEAGPQVDRSWNGVIVSYNDVDGNTYTVGPVGSGATVTSTSLVSTDPQNAANAAGLRRWTGLDVGITTTAAGAIEIGRRFLIESAQLDRSGSAAIVGTCLDENGVCRPAWQVRAGDQISFIDAADTSYRRIVRKTYDHDTYTSTIDLDAPPAGLEALLERLSAVLVPLGI